MISSKPAPRSADQQDSSTCSRSRGVVGQIIACTVNPSFQASCGAAGTKT